MTCIFSAILFVSMMALAMVKLILLLGYFLIGWEGIMDLSQIHAAS